MKIIRSLEDLELIKDVFKETDLSNERNIPPVEEDKVLICIDCKSEFVWSIGAQSYYKERHLSAPKRCKECSKKRIF